MYKSDQKSQTLPSVQNWDFFPPLLENIHAHTTYGKTSGKQKSDTNLLQLLEILGIIPGFSNTIFFLKNTDHVENIFKEKFLGIFIYMN